MTKIQLDEQAQTVEERLKVTLTCISEMRGAYPDIALPDDIDRAALGEALGADAFFVTLPIGQAGAKSRNGRRYSREAVEQMVAQINQKRLEGMWGHLAEDEAQTRYDPPAIRWLAAALDGDGVAWGKGLPLTAATREYYRLAKATNARVGTSLVAWAQMDGDVVKGLELVTVDLADPARVGVPVTAAKAHISKEMRTEVRGLRTEEKRALGRPELALVAELLNMSGGEDDVVERVRTLVREREALREAAITAAVAQAVVIPDARGLIEELVRAKQPQTAEEIADAVAAVAEREDVRALLRAGLAGAMGPGQRRPVARDGEAAGFFEF
jgi:hypothetical protein